jgi:hypothetical protein
MRVGLRIAFLGYSDVVPYGFGATSSSPGTAVADSAAIRADIRNLRRRADSSSAGSTGARSS